MSKEIADPKKAYELVGEVKACWRELSKSGRDSTKYAMDIGDLLLEMKKHLPHGMFQKTIEERFDFSYETSKNWMKLAQHRELVEKRLKTDEFAECLSLRGSMKLIADSKPKSTSVQGKRQRATFLAEQPSTEPVDDEEQDDCNAHVRQQIINEAATGDINKPSPPPPEPEAPDWKGLLDLVGQVRRAADTCNRLSGRKGKFCEQFQDTCGILDDIVRDWRKAK